MKSPTKVIDRKICYSGYQLKKILFPHLPVPSPERSAGEPEDFLDAPSLSPTMGERFRGRASNFCQPIRFQSLNQDLALPSIQLRNYIVIIQQS